MESRLAFVAGRSSASAADSIRSRRRGSGSAESVAANSSRAGPDRMRQSSWIACQRHQGESSRNAAPSDAWRCRSRTPAPTSTRIRSPTRGELSDLRRRQSSASASAFRCLAIAATSQRRSSSAARSSSSRHRRIVAFGSRQTRAPAQLYAKRGQPGDEWAARRSFTADSRIAIAGV